MREEREARREGVEERREGGEKRGRALPCNAMAIHLRVVTQTGPSAHTTPLSD